MGLRMVMAEKVGEKFRRSTVGKISPGFAPKFLEISNKAKGNNGMKGINLTRVNSSTLSHRLISFRRHDGHADVAIHVT